MVTRHRCQRGKGKVDNHLTLFFCFNKKSKKIEKKHKKVGYLKYFFHRRHIEVRYVHINTQGLGS